MGLTPHMPGQSCVGTDTSDASCTPSTAHALNTAGKAPPHRRPRTPAHAPHYPLPRPPLPRPRDPPLWPRPRDPPPRPRPPPAALPPAAAAAAAAAAARRAPAPRPRAAVQVGCAERLPGAAAGRAARAHLLHATAVVLRVPLVAGLCGRRLRAGRRARSVSARAADTQLRGVGSSVRRSGQRALPEPRQAARYVQRMHASALNVLNASPGQHNRKLPIPKIR